MRKNYIIGVIGNGFVGRATQLFGKAPDTTLYVYDVDPQKCIPISTTLDTVVTKCDIIFVCVPTPINLTTNRSDTSIVESVIYALRNAGLRSNNVICRCTVPPGTCEKLGVAHMPEYLTERNWQNDFALSPTWELGLPLGLDYDKCAFDMQSLLIQCKQSQLIISDRLILQDTKVTEMAKLMRNSMLAVRIAVCNEYEQFCRAIGINYEDVRLLATSDSRIGSSHTRVPGPDGKRGFGGTCLPKDIKALIAEMMSAGVTPFVLSAACIRNDQIDRPEQDWMENGRSTSINK